MITLKILTPYHIKVSEEYIHLKLEHQFFSIYINDEEYQFVPNESKEIIVNRKTGEIFNTDATFAFQKVEEVVYIPMSKLIYHPHFLNQVFQIAKPYYQKEEKTRDVDKAEIDLIILELEQQNKRRLIDKALDNRDEELFYKLIQML
ncbi:MAG TPA: IDEAL domain-containing protein [Candidatus Avamphibacillus sp.]|nr:IDEAL domain-containing protein [Candidatus Avamphibacillus sp.]